MYQVPTQVTFVYKLYFVLAYLPQAGYLVHASATKNEFKFRFETCYQTTLLSTVGRW